MEAGRNVIMVTNQRNLASSPELVTIHTRTYPKNRWLFINGRVPMGRGTRLRPLLGLLVSFRPTAGRLLLHGACEFRIVGSENTVVGQFQDQQGRGNH